MRIVFTLALAGCTWLALGSQAFADVQIVIRDGRVSIAAKDATVRQILTEWARVGQTQIVNVERIAGGPITIELNNVPEQDALDMLLRSLSGYIVAPRASIVSGASLFDRIIVMPTTAPPRAPVSSAAALPPAPLGQLNAGLEPVTEDEERFRGPAGVAPPPAVAPIFNNIPPVPNNPRRPANINGGPAPGVFGVPPQNDQPVALPQAAATPAAQPAASPFGAVSAPGMIAPAPAPAPGQPGFPVQVVPQQRRPNDN
jgi:hypothetical protein